MKGIKFDKNPDFKTEVRSLCNVITEIDNVYLQAWADAGAYVMCSGGDFWIMTNFGQLWLKIHEDKMHLECIAVHADERRNGNGSKLMGYVTQFADQTGVPVSLEVSKVTSGSFMGMPHPVVAIGQKTKNKIPVASLPKWYEKHGFVKTPEYSQKKRSMLYTPKKK